MQAFRQLRPAGGIAETVRRDHRKLLTRTSGTIERLRSITIFRIALTTTSAPTGGRTTGVTPTNTRVTQTSTRVTMTNTRIPPKNTGGGAPQHMPPLRRGCMHTTAQETRVTAPEAMIPAPEATGTALEATILAALEATITA